MTLGVEEWMAVKDLKRQWRSIKESILSAGTLDETATRRMFELWFSVFPIAVKRNFSKGYPGLARPTDHVNGVHARICIDKGRW